MGLLKTTLAAIDIGSNAIRFLVNDVERIGDRLIFNKTAYLRVPIRLGEDVFTRGYVTGNKKRAFEEAMMGFSYLLKAYEVSDYMACATSAMRDALNGEEIRADIYKRAGIDIRIISGKEEAEFIFSAGGLDIVTNKAKNYLYVDVGGGSTEIILFSKGKIIESRSFSIGTVRLLEGQVTEREKELFRSFLQDVDVRYKGFSMIASGGNINKIHKLLGKKEKEVVAYDELLALHNSLSKLNYEERILRFNLNSYRADVIMPALQIFLIIGKICSIHDIYVPRVGVADGIIHYLYKARNKG